MKLLLLDDWKCSASTKDGIPLAAQRKIYYDMYEFARQLETYHKQTEHPTFNQYFQKGLSIFHRFSHQISLKSFDRYIYMTACLFLSAKDQDMFNWQVDRYVNIFLLYCVQHLSNSQSSCSIRIINDNPTTFDKDSVQVYTSRILDAESHILHLIGYDLNIIVPQEYFLQAKNLIKLETGDQQKFFDVAQRLLTDLFMTNLCLYYEPKILMLSTLYKTTCMLKSVIQDSHIHWYQIYDTYDNQTQFQDLLDVQLYFDEYLKVIKGDIQQ